MKRVMYLGLAVLIILGAQTFSPPSWAQIQRAVPLTQRTDPTKPGPIVGNTAAIEVKGIIFDYLVSVKGIGNENEVIEQKVAGPKGESVQKFPGRFKISDIVIKRNISSNLDFFKWRMEVLKPGGLAAARRDGSIMFFDASLKEIARYNIFRAWPSQYRGIVLDGQSPLTEELVLTVEGIERVR